MLLPALSCLNQSCLFLDQRLAVLVIVRADILGDLLGRRGCRRGRMRVSPANWTATRPFCEPLADGLIERPNLLKDVLEVLRKLHHQLLADVIRAPGRHAASLRE